jgi:hypothetical protein
MINKESSTEFMRGYTYVTASKEAPYIDISEGWFGYEIWRACGKPAEYIKDLQKILGSI